MKIIKKMRLVTLISLCWISLLSGCAQLPQSHQSESTDIDYYELAQQGYDDWLKQSSNLVLLAQAIRHYEQLLHQQPDHLKAQYYHYRAKASLAINLAKNNEAELIAEFNRLNPSLYPESVSPAYVTYIILYNQLKADNQLSSHFGELENIILRAIKQNPYTSQNWLVLSELYQQQDKIELAIAAAKQAIRIQPAEPLNAKALAMAVNNKAEQESCIYQNTGLLELSLDYFQQAYQLNPELSNIHEYMAFQQFRLGKLEKANELAASSFAKMPLYTSGLLTFETSLILKRTELAEKAMAYLQAEHESAKIRSYQVLLALAKQDNELVGHYLSQFAQQNEPANMDLYIALLLDYIQKNPSEKSFSRSLIQNSNVKSSALSESFFEVGALDPNQVNTLLAPYQSSCDLSDAYYLLAFKAMMNSQTKLAYQYFNRVIEQSAYRQPSYLWASAILQTEQMQSYSDYMQRISKEAQNGIAKAQFDLGLEYLLAELVPYNVGEAVNWLEQSAAQNYPAALNLMAYLLANGEGITQDLEKAVKLYLLSANAGNAQAWYELALLYKPNSKIKQNLALAFEYMENAAELGHTDAKLELAQFYLDGMGTEINVSKAFSLIEQSALAGNYQAQIQLALFYRQQNKADSELLALAWLHKAYAQLKPDSETAKKLRDMLAQKEISQPQIDKQINLLNEQMQQYQASLAVN